MQRESIVRSAKRCYIALSICLSTYGIGLMLRPPASLSMIAKTAGIILIVFGAIRIWGRFSGDLYRLAFQDGLATGILGISVGAILIAMREAMEPLGMVLGATALIDALTRVEIAIDARSFGVGSWWSILAVGILTGVFGFLLILQPVRQIAGMTALTGAALLTMGILNLLTALLTIRVRSCR